MHDARMSSPIKMIDLIEKETIFTSNVIKDLLGFAAKRLLQKKRQGINNLTEDCLVENNKPCACTTSMRGVSGKEGEDGQ